MTSQLLLRMTGGTKPVAVTPSDANDLAIGGVYPIGISLGAGTLVIEDTDGDSVSFADGELSAGSIHPIGCSKVKATGTSATPIKVYYPWSQSEA